MARSSDKWSIYDDLNYQPHDGQRAFHDSNARFKLLIAGSRFGKSLAAAREVLPLLAQANTRGWIVAPSYRLGEKELRYILDDLNVLGWPITSKKLGGAHAPSSLKLAWNAELSVVSASRPENLLGEELDWLVLSEASQLASEVWTRFLRARLTSRKGSLIVPSTPSGYNWLHELYLQGVDAAHPNWRAFRYRTQDNPMIPADEIEEARRTLPKEVFQEQYEGSFTSRSGLVYPEFSSSQHVTDHVDLVGEWERYGAVDFGFSNPFVLLFAAFGQGGRIVIYDEYFAIGRTMNAHVEALQGRDLQHLKVIFADPSGASWISEFRNQGLNVQRSRNDLLYGIDLVRRRLLPGNDGRPGLVVLSRCINLIREFTSYRYDEHPNSDGEKRPLKQDDHALDALRYLCLSLEDRVTWSKVRK